MKGRAYCGRCSGGVKGKQAGKNSGNRAGLIQQIQDKCGGKRKKLNTVKTAEDTTEVRKHIKHTYD